MGRWRPCIIELIACGLADRDLSRLNVFRRHRRLRDPRCEEFLVLHRERTSVAMHEIGEQRLALVDRMVAAQTAKAAFHAAQPDGTAFGSSWEMERSDWDQLDDILAWRAQHAILPTEIFYVADVDELYDRALAAGCRPTTAPRDAEWGERFFHLVERI